MENMNEKLRPLVESWCDRRCYVALRYILKAWPLSQALTDDFAHLLDALKGVRAFAKGELLKAELETVEDLIREAEKIVYR